MPALINTFLFIEPQKHYLDYASVVLQRIVQEHKQSGQTITELVGSDANPERIKQEIATLKPALVLGVGHGSINTFTVECTTPFLHAQSPSELELMNERIVSLLSCLTAQVLGPALIDAGATAYTGYKQEFWFYTGDEPGTTRAVQSPFTAEFQFAISLLQGKTTGQAREDQLNKYDEEITYWTTGDGRNHAVAPELANILQMNKDNSVFLGEPSVKPSSGQTGALGIQVPAPLTMGFALLSMGYLIYRSATVR